MGQEILYCYKCQTRLLGSEFEKGKAFKVGAQASCKDCVKDLLATVPETAYETDRGRKLQSTTRIPAQASESGSGKYKAAARPVPPPAPPTVEKSKTTLVVGIVVAALVLILLGLAMSSKSPSPRNEAPPPPVSGPTPPTPGPTPPAPPVAAGFTAELRDLDEKIRSVTAPEDLKIHAALLEEARKRRASAEWLSEIDLRIAQVEGRARRHALPLRDKAVEAQKAKDAVGAKTLRDRVASWGFSSVTDDFDKALAEAEAAPPPLPPPPATPPTPPVVVAPDPNAPPAVMYAEGLGKDILQHNWDGTADFQSTRKAYSGTKSLAWTLKKQWGAVYLTFGRPIDVARYPYLAFSILIEQESPMASVTLWGGERGKGTLIGLEAFGPLEIGKWKRYIIPVSRFNLPGDKIHSFVLQSGKLTTEPLFYLDDLMFLPTAEDKTPPPPVAPGNGKWLAAAAKAAVRDYDGAAKELDDPADLELVKLAAQVPVEAGKILDKWSRGQKVRLVYVGAEGEQLLAEGGVLTADPVRVVLAREDGPLDVPVSEIAPSSLAELFRSRADRKPTDARAAAAFCAFEGDVDGLKKFAGENAALPEKYAAFAQKRAALSEAEVSARRVFWAAEAEFQSPKRRSSAIEKYASLQAAPELARLRPYVAARLEAAKETLFLPEDLTGTGTFAVTGNLKVETYWSSNADSSPAKAKENYVEAEFHYFPGTTPKAWVWAGGCCQETFDASWQGSELTAPNSKNPKEPISCEPGSDAAPALKIAASLRKWHAQHGGPKEPARWEWVPLALPKYETAGPKKIRILTSQQGFSVAAIFVSAIRREPPRDAEMKEAEKAHAVSRKAGGNEPPGQILHEWWIGIEGDYVEHLVKSPQFQGKPSGTALRSIFEAPENMADRFGARWRGFIHPPVTGNYTFWIASDDNSELFLSVDETPFKKRSIASAITGGVRDWTRVPSARSAPIPLVAGKRYYIEALHKEGGGGDHLAVGWTLPDGTEERPIPGKRLSPWTLNPSGANPAIVPAGTFYRGIALNSPAAVIDGRRWEGKGAPDVSVPEGFENFNVPLNPMPDAAKATMIRSSVFARSGTWVKMDRVPPGTYQVYLYIWEDNADQLLDFTVNGKEVMKGYHTGEGGHWDRLGPWPATVTNGSIDVRASAGDANFSGLEVWRVGK